MSRRIADIEAVIDPEIERTLHQRQRELRQQLERFRRDTADVMEGVGDNNVPQREEEVHARGDRPLFEYIRPRATGAQSSIRRPPVQEIILRSSLLSYR